MFNFLGVLPERLWKLHKQTAVGLSPEESIKQVKLNNALISYRCSHLPLTRDRRQTVSNGFFNWRHPRNVSHSVTGYKLSGV